jgi:nucleotide-binding universal stress UspA family protein
MRGGRSNAPHTSPLPATTCWWWARSSPSSSRISTEGAHQDPSEAEHRRQNLEDAKAFLAERGVEAETVEAYGDPGSAIVDAAEDADLVVVGSRGRNTLERLLLGSVSSKVVHRAKSDVLVVR